MFISKWMDKEVVVYIHNGTLLSYKKECIWVSSNEVDEPGAYYTEWSKSERERQMLYINAYIWNFKRRYWWSYMQGTKGDTDVKKRLMEKTLESSLDIRGIKPVNPKGNQPWIFIGRTHAEVEAPILWLPDAKSWLNGKKNSDAGKDWE